MNAMLSAAISNSVTVRRARVQQAFAMPDRSGTGAGARGPARAVDREASALQRSGASTPRSNPSTRQRSRPSAVDQGDFVRRDRLARTLLDRQRGARRPARSAGGGSRDAARRREVAEAPASSVELDDVELVVQLLLSAGSKPKATKRPSGEMS